MPDRDRLRALQVRVARHRRLGFLLGAREHVACQPAQRAVGFEACILDIEPQRRSHLVVARAAGMDLPPDVAEQALDHGVDVLVVRETIRGGHRRKDPLRLLELRVVEQAGGMQAPGMEPRAFEVVRQQLGVVRQEIRPDLGRHPFDGPGPTRESCRLCRHPPASRSKLRLQRGKADEAFRGLVRKRLAGRVRGERLRVEGLVRAAPRDDGGAGS